jgi:predicted dithiol-disulfide oxidoreductase (DUF899 family)
VVELPRVVSRDEWLVARRELLAKEKELTRAYDELSAGRRGLPMVLIDKEYVFEGPDGKARLADLFDGRRQLIVYHFMWLDETDQGCPSCSLIVDNIGDLRHLHACDTTLVIVSRAPLASIERFRHRMGWTVPWFSSHGSDFNYDFHVTSDETIAPPEYNYLDKAALERRGIGFWVSPGQDGPGASVFVRDGDRVFHTYSAYARGAESLIGTYHYLDLTPLGRQRHVSEFRYHDQYGEPEGQPHHHH